METISGVETGKGAATEPPLEMAKQGMDPNDEDRDKKEIRWSPHLDKRQRRAICCDCNVLYPDVLALDVSRKPYRNLCRSCEDRERARQRNNGAEQRRRNLSLMQGTNA